MTRIAAALLFLVLPVSLAAQQQPRVSAKLSGEATAVGQPLSLVIEVLVPSFMPKPPVFPELEQPGLLVQLPPRAGSPVTRRIEGEDWSGVSRRYRLTPLTQGRFTLAPAEVQVTWRGGTGEGDLQAGAPLPALSFQATVPAAAATLNPPLLAEGLELTQTIDGGPDLAVGDAVTRTVTARISGTTPILLPELLSQGEGLAGLRAYPAEVRVQETGDRGKTSGTRTEKITYIASGAGTAELPPVSLSWYDLTAQDVRTERLPGTVITVKTPPEPPATPAEMALRAGAVIGTAAVLVWLYLRLQPVVRQKLDAARAAYRASEACARRQVLTALSARDLSGVHRAYQQWQNRLPPDAAAAAAAAFPSIAAPLGAVHSAASAAAPSAGAWAEAAGKFKRLVPALRISKSRAKSAALPETLNPG